MSQAAQLLRESRRKAGMTQRQLANAMGTTQSAVARMEAEGANPRLRTLEQAVWATGHTLELRAPLPQVDERQIVEHLRLSPAERLAVFETSRDRLREVLAGARWVKS
jgi:predicted transcriptional regulator